jgi:hypothetical protein
MTLNFELDPYKLERESDGGVPWQVIKTDMYAMNFMRTNVIIDLALTATGADIEFVSTSSELNKVEPGRATHALLFGVVGAEDVDFSPVDPDNLGSGGTYFVFDQSYTRPVWGTNNPYIEVEIEPATEAQIIVTEAVMGTRFVTGANATPGHTASATNGNANVWYREDWVDYADIVNGGVGQIDYGTQAITTYGTYGSWGAFYDYVIAGGYDEPYEITPAEYVTVSTPAVTERTLNPKWDLKPTYTDATTGVTYPTEAIFSRAAFDYGKKGDDTFADRIDYFTLNDDGEYAANIQFALATATGGNEANDPRLPQAGLAADNKGISSFMFYADLNSQAMWQQATIEVEGIYTLYPCMDEEFLAEDMWNAGNAKGLNILVPDADNGDGGKTPLVFPNDAPVMLAGAAAGNVDVDRSANTNGYAVYLSNVYDVPASIDNVQRSNLPTTPLTAITSTYYNYNASTGKLTFNATAPENNTITANATLADGSKVAFTWKIVP